MVNELTQLHMELKVPFHPISCSFSGCLFLTSNNPHSWGKQNCKRHFGMCFFLFKSYPGTSSRPLKPAVILPYGAHICNMRELIITFSLVLKINFKWEWLPHRLRELKQQSKVLELFPNQGSSHIPAGPAVRDPRCCCGEGGEQSPFSAFHPRRLG